MLSEQPPVIKIEGLNTIPKTDNSELAEYWRSQGGTLHALPYKLSPISPTPDMALWTRISAELIGGEGIIPKPADVETVIGWNWRKIKCWFDAMCPATAEMHPDRIYGIARFLIGCIFTGKASAHSEVIASRQEQHKRSINKHGRRTRSGS